MGTNKCWELLVMWVDDGIAITYLENVTEGCCRRTYWEKFPAFALTVSAIEC